MRRPLILVEDDRLDPDTLDLCPPGSDAFDIVACTGPSSATEECPLVMNGVCPHGFPDVVVTALSPDNEWRTSVANAWEQDGVPVVRVAPDESLAWPAHVGAAIAAFYAEP